MTRKGEPTEWVIPFFLGVFGLFWFFFSLLLAFLSSDDWLGVYALWICAPVTSGASLVLIGYGLAMRRRARRLSEIATMLRAYRRIKISDLARKLAVTEFEAERVIARCIELGMVEGHIDRTTGEFFTPESVAQVVKLSPCPYCGSPADQLVLSGETAKCPACGAVFDAERKVVTQ
ncbi:MAG: PCI domain-containing protein [Euryarchaeota archaeon]|nr:PCI domain-containing protein [Euryarchaeota archaeon]